MAPAAIRIVSPGCAALIAPWRSPPTFTVIVAALAETTDRKRARTRPEVMIFMGSPPRMANDTPCAIRAISRCFQSDAPTRASFLHDGPAELRKSFYLKYLSR